VPPASQLLLIWEPTSWQGDVLPTKQLSKAALVHLNQYENQVTISTLPYHQHTFSSQQKPLFTNQQTKTAITEVNTAQMPHLQSALLLVGRPKHRNTISSVNITPGSTIH